MTKYRIIKILDEYYIQRKRSFLGVWLYFRKNIYSANHGIDFTYGIEYADKFPNVGAAEQTVKKLINPEIIRTY
jgi:hypothetical protein